VTEDDAAVPPPTSGTGEPIRVLVVDDHALFRRGLQMVVEQEDDIEVVGEAGDGAAAVTMVRRLQPDLLFLDMNIRGGGLDTLKVLATLPSAVRSIMLMDPVQPDLQKAAMRLGARGVMAKESSIPHFVQSIHGVMRDQTCAPHDQVPATPPPASAPKPPAHARKFRLTQREMQVVAAVADGETNKGIAERFRVSEDTVKHHLSNVFDKVGVSSRLELAVFAFTHGLVMLQDGIVMMSDGGVLPPV